MKRTDITELFPDATPEQIQKLMDLNGADINNAKKDLSNIQGQLAEAQKAAEAAKTAAASGTELQQAQEKAAKLEKELGALKLSNQLRELRSAVAKEKGVPVELLTGETPEACQKQADGILAFAKAQPGYPALPDGGEVHTPASGATRDKFAAWAAGKI